MHCSVELSLNCSLLIFLHAVVRQLGLTPVNAFAAEDAALVLKQPSQQEWVAGLGSRWMSCPRRPWCLSGYVLAEPLPAGTQAECLLHHAR